MDQEIINYLPTGIIVGDGIGSSVGDGDGDGTAVIVGIGDGVGVSSGFGVAALSLEADVKKMPEKSASVMAIVNAVFFNI